MVARAPAARGSVDGEPPATAPLDLTLCPYWGHSSLSHSQLWLITAGTLLQPMAGGGDSSNRWLWSENSMSLPTQVLLPPFISVFRPAPWFSMSAPATPTPYHWQAFIPSYLGVSFKLLQSLKSRFVRQSRRNWRSVKNMLHPVSWEEWWKRDKIKEQRLMKLSDRNIVLKTE